MKKISKIIVSLLTAALAISSLAACDKVTGKKDYYTFNSYMVGTAADWNPHTWTNSLDSTILSMVQDGFYSYIVDPDTVGEGQVPAYKLICDMAAELPVDVTSTYAVAGNVYGLKAGTTSGHAFKIKIRDNLKWDDAEGTPIKVDSYLKSLEYLLDYEMQNMRSDTFREREYAFANAQKFYKAGQKIYKPIADVEWTDDGLLVKVNGVSSATPNYFALTDKVNMLWGYYSLKDIYDMGYTTLFMNGETDLVKKYLGTGELNGMIPIPASGEARTAVINDLKKIYSNFSSAGMLDADIKAVTDAIVAKHGAGSEWMSMAYSWTEGDFEEDLPFTSVGLKKLSDTEMVVIYEKAQDIDRVPYVLGGDWLVHEGLYNSLRDTVGKLNVTNYGKNAESTRSTSPYSLTSYQTDKQYTFKKNPNWYGWELDSHKDFYQADEYIIKVYQTADPATIDFDSGLIDSVSFNSTDMQKYGGSERVLKTMGMNTWRFSFNTSSAALANIEATDPHGSASRNLQMLTNQNFRRAISLSIDRAYFAKNLTAASDPAFTLLNDRFLYDAFKDPSSIYRYTNAAKQVLIDLYDVDVNDPDFGGDIDEAIKSITGYDVTMAKELFTKAAQEMNYDNRTVKFTCWVPANTFSASLQAQMDFFSNSVATAAKGTPFENKINLIFKPSGGTRSYDWIRNGEIEMAFTSISGDSTNPFGFFDIYTDAENSFFSEHGYVPSAHIVEITADFNGDGTPEKVSSSVTQWQKDITTGKYIDAPASVKLIVLAALEKAILENCATIPLYAANTNSMLSYKVEYITTTYVQFAARGGLRQLKFLYDDYEWEVFVKSHNGQLDYTI